MGSHRLAGVAAVLFTLTTACDAVTAGQPGPETAQHDATTRTSAPTGSTAAEANPFDGMDPCQLLTAEELAELRVTEPGKRDELLGATACDWNPPGSGVVGVILDPVRPVAELNRAGARLEPVTIGRHHGRRAEQNRSRGYCSIDLEITASSSASIDASSFDDLAQACAITERVARLVEPRLP